jgi:Dehydrogenases with different specificities (related to short-chain alcohol dehydrogenases)
MKTVLITGASGNLGKAAVEKFTSEGYHIIATVSPGKALGFDVGNNVTTAAVDMSNEKDVESLINTISATQSIDAALLLVGGYASGSIKDTDEKALEKMFSLNFHTTYFAARAIFAQMTRQKQGGRIIFVGARPALSAQVGKSSLAYGLSKSLIFKLAEYLNAEGADQNIVSHVIVPSIIDTPQNRAAMPKANFSDWVKPEEIANAMVTLCSEGSSSFRETILKIYNRS